MRGISIIGGNRSSQVVVAMSIEGGRASASVILLGDAGKAIKPAKIDRQFSIPKLYGHPNGFVLLVMERLRHSIDQQC